MKIKFLNKNIEKESAIMVTIGTALVTGLVSAAVSMVAVAKKKQNQNKEK